jgi:hypothetical protein
MEKSDGDMVKAAVSILTAALIKDKGFRLTWQCNIAQAVADNWDDQAPTPQNGAEIANAFISHLCQTKFEVL